ncbi:hypothetical protein [Leisingera aquimarina]|uniref:hypothetical protein n=1 Tax=Leisingera aquimarina TaxID=476529 RepID=UPI0012EB214D|nr:hypothetical protein [Leisingera aquimarina]
MRKEYSKTDTKAGVPIRYAWAMSETATTAPAAWNRVSHRKRGLGETQARVRKGPAVSAPGIRLTTASMTMPAVPMKRKIPIASAGALSVAQMWRVSSMPSP